VVLAGVGLTGLAGAVSACGQAGGGSGGSTSGPPATSAPAVTAGSSASSSEAAGAAGALGVTSEIPVGGGKVFTSAKVVVTQPTAGQFKGFSAVCTHMHCTVAQVANGTIDCPCHGSRYSVKDGSVVSGPAPSPLPPVSIKVTGTSIELG
jgi:Rieske Fe-S protein